MTVRFYELTGPEARSRLARLARDLAAAGARTELLESAEQPGLWLLVVRGVALPEPEPPEGARVWRFRTTDA